MTEPTTIDGIVVAGFANVLPALAPVAAAGLAIAGLIWGVPKAVGFFKKTAK
jgi:hypothetical protein